MNKQGFSGLQVFLMIVFAVVLSVAITLWLLFTDIFVTKFDPVALNVEENMVLDEKLTRLGIEDINTSSSNSNKLEPEPYSESDAERSIKLSEKELNALLANNTNLASRLAIDLSNNLLSLKYLLPLDKDLPILGGKTLKVTAGVELHYEHDRPVVIVKGVSVWGVPLPASYLGDIKNVDLIKEFGESGFWKGFADGVKNLKIEKGYIYIYLKQ